METLANERPALAIVAGERITEVPADLFIPPDALEILLDSFSGPLDLLLYLIRRQNIDILNIPLVKITEQYIHYIHLMEVTRVELAADYLVMAAWLTEIKSRLLLPKKQLAEEEIGEDPRLELIKKLQVYENFKNAALQLDAMPRCERDVFRFSLKIEKFSVNHSPPQVELCQLATLMEELLNRQSHLTHHQVVRENLSVRERMSTILYQLQAGENELFTTFLRHQEGRKGLVVTLLAVLELARQSLLLVKQTQTYAPIYLKAVNHERK